MTEPIWATTATDPRVNMFFMYPQHQMPTQLWLENIEKVSRGLKIDRDGLPDQMWWADDRPTDELLPVFSSDYRYVTLPFKKVIECFDLGKTFLHRVELFDREGKSKVSSEPYWGIAVQEQRETVDRAAGIAEGWLKPHPRRPEEFGRWRGSLGKTEVKLLLDLPPDVDIWCDTYMSGVFFFSDRLKRALDEVEGVEHLHLVRVG